MYLKETQKRRCGEYQTDFVPITLPAIIVDLCTKESCELTTADQRKTHDDKSRVQISPQSSFMFETYQVV